MWKEKDKAADSGKVALTHDIQLSVFCFHTVILFNIHRSSTASF